MGILQAIFLGIVQGLTEFLPVSSSGHLTILEKLCGINTDGGMLFDILLHVGTLLAIFVAYHRDIWKMIKETIFMIGNVFSNLYTLSLNKRHKTKFKYKRILRNSYRRFVVLIIVSTIPTAVLGVLVKKLEEHISSGLLIPGLCLLITAVLLLMADTTHEGHKLPRHITMRDALLIGLAQGCATLPGLSRSGTTIAVCLLLGMDRRFAVKYSFILSIPAVLGAAVLEVSDVFGETFTTQQIGIYAAGMFFSAVVGYICIKTMLILVRKKKFTGFAVYCTLIGLFAIAGYVFL